MTSDPEEAGEATVTQSEVGRPFAPHPFTRPPGSGTITGEVTSPARETPAAAVGDSPQRTEREEPADRDPAPVAEAPGPDEDPVTPPPTSAPAMSEPTSEGGPLDRMLGPIFG